MNRKTDPFKLLVVDIDGTLLIRANEISSRDKAAIAEARRQGIGVSLCSGRATEAARSVLGQLNLDGYHIFFDGALVTDSLGQEEIYVRSIGRELLSRAVGFARDNQVFMDLFSARGYFAEQENWVTDIRRDYFGVVATILDFAHLPESEKVIKGTLVVRSTEEKAAAERFRSCFNGDLKLSKTLTPAYPDVDFVNVVAPGVSKKAALEALVRHLGIRTEEVMAIGDGVNDIPILSVAGLGVAMGNAIPEVKAAARYVTADVEHGGVAEAIDRFLLNR